jgi:hypothetical protein
VEGFGSVMKKCMNMLSSHRIIGIQEAQYSVMQMPLTISSELPYYLNTTTKMKLYVDHQDSTIFDMKTCYAARNKEYKSMSLAEYFYKVHKKRLNKSNGFRNDYLKDSNMILPSRNPVLTPRGRNLRSVYPPSFEYARAVMMMYIPWSKNEHLDFSNKSKTVCDFEHLIRSKYFPTAVTAQYTRAEFYAKHRKIDVISKKMVPIDIEEDEEEDEYSDFRVYAKAMNHFTNNNPVPCSIGDMSFNVGTNHDWTKSTASHIPRILTRSGSSYMEWIKTKYAKAYSSKDDINKPNDTYRHDRTREQYNFSGLSGDQKNIALAVIVTIHKFLTNADDYTPLRATISGAGGCGKSHLIHTIQNMINEYCDGDMSCFCSAPSGSAAFKIGGSTVHSFAGVNVTAPWTELSEEARAMMKKKLRYILCLIIDERSQLGAKTVAAAERNLRETVFNEHAKNIPWGGIPVILLFGDDYQLPPVLVDGAITLFGKRTNIKKNFTRNKATKQSSNGQCFNHIGGDILMNELTERSFELQENFRQRDTDSHNDQSIFRGILSRLRICKHTDDDCKTIMSLRLSNIQLTDYCQHIENHRKTLYLYSANRPKNERNLKMLHKLSTETNEPVALINAQFEHASGSQKAIFSHFDRKSIIMNSPLCIGCRVAITSMNICPTWGLYNGCLGTVVDIIYDHPQGPNNYSTNIPKYVIVDIPEFKPPPHVDVWDENNPTVCTFLKILCSFPTYSDLISSFLITACTDITHKKKMQKKLLRCYFSSPHCSICVDIA